MVFSSFTLTPQKIQGNSLVAQWLGLHAFSAEGPSSSLLWELRSRKPHSVTKKSTFTLLCNRPHHPSLELSHLPKLKLYPRETLIPQPLAPTIYYPSCLVDLTPPGTFHRGRN